MALKTAERKRHVRHALETLFADRDERLLRIDEYQHGIQDDPYMPKTADAEYRLLAQRSITNVCDFIVNATAQAMYVDQFRRGLKSEDMKDGDAEDDDAEGELGVGEQLLRPEWDHWQRSRLDGRQAAVYRGALSFGHSFVLTEKVDDQVISKGLSPLRTIAMFKDPANDDDPVLAVHVVSWPDVSGDKKVPGKARAWDDTYEYRITFKSEADLSEGLTVKVHKKHGATTNPVTRFAATVDLDGRTLGLIEPIIPVQNRINQTVFDLLVVQSYGSFKVRTVSGMAPPLDMKPIDIDGNEVIDPVEDDPRVVNWTPRTGADGRPKAQPIDVTARRFLMAADPETKWGTLDETPLDGFIKAIELAFQQMAALSQTPPHHLLGQIANLSAEALEAAESSLDRKVEEFKHAFGESWERVFRVAAEIGGYEGADDYSGEVIWRDMGNRALNQIADGLGKVADQLGIPKRGLWARMPNVTSNELATWEKMYREESSQMQANERAQRQVEAVPTLVGPTRTPRSQVRAGVEGEVSA